MNIQSYIKKSFGLSLFIISDESFDHIYTGEIIYLSSSQLNTAMHNNVTYFSISELHTAFLDFIQAHSNIQNGVFHRFDIPYTDNLLKLRYNDNLEYLKETILPFIKSNEISPVLSIPPNSVEIADQIILELADPQPLDIINSYNAEKLLLTYKDSAEVTMYILSHLFKDNKPVQNREQILEALKQTTYYRGQIINNIDSLNDIHSIKNIHIYIALLENKIELAEILKDLSHFSIASVEGCISQILKYQHNEIVTEKQINIVIENAWELRTISDLIFCFKSTDYYRNKIKSDVIGIEGPKPYHLLLTIEKQLISHKMQRLPIIDSVLKDKYYTSGLEGSLEELQIKIELLKKYNEPDQKFIINKEIIDIEKIIDCYTHFGYSQFWEEMQAISLIKKRLKSAKSKPLSDNSYPVSINVFPKNEKSIYRTLNNFFRTSKQSYSDILNENIIKSRFLENSTFRADIEIKFLYLHKLCPVSYPIFQTNIQFSSKPDFDVKNFCQDYLAEMGYSYAPYLAYFDKTKNCLSIVALNIHKVQYKYRPIISILNTPKANRIVYKLEQKYGISSDLKEGKIQSNITEFIETKKGTELKNNRRKYTKRL